MIEYAQIILPAVVRLDRGLFRKELIKCVNWIEDSQDYVTFMNWCYQEFGDEYANELDGVFPASAMAG